MISLSARSTNASLPPQNGSFWGRIKGGGKSKDAEVREKHAQQQQALARQRLLTLAFDDMETIRMVRNLSCSVTITI